MRIFLLLCLWSTFIQILIANDAQCPESDILHLNWVQLNSEGKGNEDNWPDFDYQITFDQFNLEVIIDVNLSYLGYSMDKDDNVLGTTYVLDFASTAAHILPLSEPGTCSNRFASDFESVGFDEWWNYSTNDPPVVTGGSTKWLAYPPGGKNWFIESLSCDMIHYRGHFTYRELYDGCTNYDGSDKYSVLTTNNEWINLTLTFYINVVSPLTPQDTGYYRIYQLLSAPFVVAIEKTIHVLQPIGIRLFTMSVIAVYKEHNQNDFKLVVMTETAEYLKLTGGELLTYPWDLMNNHDIHFNFDHEEDSPCINNKQYICTQIWEIYATDVPCPPSNFTGVYGFQFQAVCNNDSSTDMTVNQERENSCKHWLAADEGIVDLSTNLVFVDEICDAQIWKLHFGGTMSFYNNDAYNVEVNDSYLYQVGEDRIYVEIEVNIPSGAYDVFGATLINVWLCTTDPSVEPTLDVTTGNGGCLGNNIDSDGPYYIIENHDEALLYNASIDDEDDPDKPANIVRFSFISPVTIVRDTLYIHAQLTLNLIDSTRRRLVDDVMLDVTSDQIKHFMGKINTDPTNAKPYQHFNDIEQYKKKSGFYDEPLPEKENRRFIDELNNDYDWNDDEEPVNGAPYILVTGDVFNVIKIVIVVFGFLLFANICLMLYNQYDKYREEEYRFNVQYSQY